MENFGNIKDTFKTIVIESILKKEKSGKELFSKFVKLIKEDKTLTNQYLIYKNLQTKLPPFFCILNAITISQKIIL